MTTEAERRERAFEAAWGDYWTGSDLRTKKPGLKGSEPGCHAIVGDPSGLPAHWNRIGVAIKFISGPPKQDCLTPSYFCTLHCERRLHWG